MKSAISPLFNFRHFVEFLCSFGIIKFLFALISVNGHLIRSIIIPPTNNTNNTTATTNNNNNNTVIYEFSLIIRPKILDEIYNRRKPGKSFS